jgi:glycosyltransferase involved in cell wall biosynthesis
VIPVKPPKVVYWNNIPAPYMVERFNAAAARTSLSFEAWFSGRTKRDRSWRVDESSWAFRYRYLPSVGKGAYPLALPTPLFQRDIPDVLISLYASPSFLLGWALARRRGVRTAFWVEVTFDAWVTRRRWKETLKSQVLPRADAILTPGQDGRAFAERYGAAGERIFRVPHVIDTRRYIGARDLSPSRRSRVRAELGVQGVTFVYVGRLWRGKGLTFLMDAFERVQERCAGEATLLLVGDGVDEALLRKRSGRGSANVVFAGFRHGEELPEIYAAADVFVFPTLGDPFGLVVLEAMACGLPIIATSASGEITERVAEGINGFIVPPANVEVLLDRMTLLAHDSDLRRRMGDASIAKLAGQTPDLWAEALELAVQEIVAMPSVHGEAHRPAERGAASSR